MNKKQIGMVWSYEHAKAETLYQAYGRPSYNKVRAFRDCEAAKAAHNGYGARIPSASCHFFTYAFKYRDAEGRERMQYHTHANVYDFALA